MNVSETVLWGFVATLVLTVIMSASKSLGLTRMDIPYILGTMFTADRAKARWIGFFVHLMMGWIFAFFYVWVFHSTGQPTWWFGLVTGTAHGIFVLTVGLQTAASMHPRMATEQQGPDPTRQLEPPGFLSLNYGKGTPLASMIAHMIYGTILGGFYG